MQNGELIYQKAFGSFTYNRDSKPVDNTTLYDLASITKIAASSLALMKLTSEGKDVVIVQVTSGDRGTADTSFTPESLASTREEEELEAARRTQSMLSEAAGIGAWSYEPREQRIEWSPDIHALCGWSPDDIADPADFYAILDPNQLDLIRDVFNAGVQDGVAASVEHRMKTRDGRWLTMRATFRTVARGRIFALKGISQDVTALVEALDTLSDDQREAMRLRVIDGLGYAEVAQRLRCTEQNARQRVSRGLRRIALLLQDFATAASLALALFLAVIWSATAAAGIALGSEAAGFDPALVSGPVMMGVSDLSAAALFLGVSALLIL